MLQNDIHLLGDKFIVKRDENYGQCLVDEKTSEIKVTMMPSIVIENDNYGFRFVPYGSKEVIFTKFWSSGKNSFNERAAIIRKVTDLLTDLSKKHYIKIFDDGDESYQIYKMIAGILVANKDGFVEIPKSLLDPFR